MNTLQTSVPHCRQYQAPSRQCLICISFEVGEYLTTSTTTPLHWELLVMAYWGMPEKTSLHSDRVLSCKCSGSMSDREVYSCAGKQRGHSNWVRILETSWRFECCFAQQPCLPSELNSDSDTYQQINTIIHGTAHSCKCGHKHTSCVNTAVVSAFKCYFEEHPWQFSE